MRNARVIVPVICFMFAIVAAFAGCQKNENNGNGGDTNTNPGDSPQVTLTTVDPVGLKKKMEELEGKVVVIDFWQTT